MSGIRKVKGALRNKVKGALCNSFSELMKTPEPEGINPFFQEVPSFPFRMHDNPKRMVIWFKWLINEIRTGMIQQSARENNGAAKFFMEMPIEDPLTKEIIGYRHKILITPKSGFFKVVLFPSRELVEEHGDAAKPIEFLFNFKNVYLAGFFYQNVLYVYKDADLEGLIITPSNSHFIVKMGFDGGYFDDCLETIRLGYNGLSVTYGTLLNASRRSQQQIRVALFRIFVSVSEPERFPHWMGRLLWIYRNKLHVSVDRPKDFPKTVFSANFNRWGNISTAIDNGKKVYQSRERPIPGMTEFETLLWSVSLLLCTEMASQKV